MKIHRIINSEYYHRSYGSVRAPDYPALGMEIEVEQARARFPEFKHWLVTTDGSLRDDGLEFISNGPIKFKDVNAAILEYVSMIADKDGFTHNYRTSFHVHLNVAPLTIAQFQRLLIIYVLLERGMYMMGAEWRRMSPYCVPACDVPYIFDKLMEFAKGESSEKAYYSFVQKFKSGEMKYCGLGTFRLADLCTLEFRMHEGTNDEERMVMFTDVIRGMYDAAITTTDVYQCANDIINKLIPCDLVDAARKGLEQSKFEIDMLPLSTHPYRGMADPTARRWGFEAMQNASWDEGAELHPVEERTVQAGTSAAEALFQEIARQRNSDTRATQRVVPSDADTLAWLAEPTTQPQPAPTTQPQPAPPDPRQAPDPWEQASTHRVRQARSPSDVEALRTLARQLLEHPRNLPRRECVDYIVNQMPARVRSSLDYDSMRMREYARSLLHEERVARGRRNTGPTVQINNTQS